MYLFKDLRGYFIYVPDECFSFVEQLKIYISNVHPHIEPYLICVCVDGVMLNRFDRLPNKKTIHVWQKYQKEKYKVSDVFDALLQINGVCYTPFSDSDSDSDSFHSIASCEM